ncbi:hypothetical protein [Streptomyces sp. MspMP-M5]|uniref:MmyB family transcriptional regulator n=1 Tax=unclassified Streptomyces TaxID=2593676 RepID=UPI001F3D0DEE|nr:hypothetical protein [Streptomyces sp. MspMP-M5]
MCSSSPSPPQAGPVARRRVRSRSKHFHHPVVGPLTLNYESLTPPADPDQRLSVHTAEEGSSSEEALGLLATWIRQPETSHGQHADHEGASDARRPARNGRP